MRNFGRFSKLCILGSLLAIAGCEIKDEERAASQKVSQPAAAQPATHTGDLNFVTENLDEGIALAEKNNRPILVFFTASWCHYCHEMARESFTNPQVVAQSRDFVCVLIDGGDKKNETLCKQLQIKGYPTVFFLSPRGVVLNRTMGKRSPQEVLQQMQAALQGLAAAQSHPDIQRL